MNDVFEQNITINLSRVELRTIQLALANLPDDEEGIAEVVKKLNPNKEIPKATIKTTQEFKRILKHRLLFHEFGSSTLEYFSKYANSNDEYEEID